MMEKISLLCSKRYAIDEKGDRHTGTCYAVAGAIVYNYYKRPIDKDWISPAQVKELLGRDIKDGRGMPPDEALQGLGAYSGRIEPLPVQTFLLRVQAQMRAKKPVVLNIQLDRGELDDGTEARAIEHAVVVIGIEAGRPGAPKIWIKDWLHSCNQSLELAPRDQTKLVNGREHVLETRPGQLWLSGGGRAFPSRIVAAYTTQRPRG